jgi:DNA-binding NtrC family response regulator
VNCGAVPDHLFENELFGHVRGAYTDARTNESGLLAYAESGTLFLDEVDSLSMAAQVKLLRVLQEREYRRLGSAQTVPTNTRILAATNTDLHNAIQARRFREDLYFRLNILNLEIPPLRERLEDIDALAAHYVREYSGTHNKPIYRIEPPAVEKLRNYHWPGNVRELQAVLQRAVLKTRDTSIAARDLELPGSATSKQEHVTLKAAKIAAVAQCERSYLSTVLQRCQGNVTQAAKMAGKERRSFQRLLRKHSIGVIAFKKSQEVA